MKKLSLIIMASLFIYSCSSTKNEKNEITTTNDDIITLTNEQLKGVNIQTAKIENRNLSDILKLNGKIDVPPQNIVSVSAPFGGFLKQTKLLPGMRIKKGEVIAVMEDQQYIQLQQDYLTTRSKLHYYETEFKRQKDLNISKATSDKIMEQSEMDYSTQKIALSALAEKLRLINIDPNNLDETNLSRNVNIYSTINGFVSKVNINIGKYVNPSDVLFELINPEDIHLNLKVFEKDIDKISIGQKIIAYSNNRLDEKHECEIILISQDLSADRSAEVHCHFNDYNKLLLPGMYMNADVEINLINTPTIPSEAIVNFEGQDLVFIALNNHTFKLQKIKKGVSHNGYTAIKSVDESSLSNKLIIIKGAYTLLMQLKNTPE